MAPPTQFNSFFQPSCGKVEVFADLHREQVKDGIPEDHDSRYRGVEVQVAEAERLHEELELGWVFQRPRQICETVHDAKNRSEGGDADTTVCSHCKLSLTMLPAGGSLAQNGGLPCY